LGGSDLDVDWPKLSSRLETNLTAPRPIRSQYVKVGSFIIDGSASDWNGINPIISRTNSVGAKLSSSLKAVYALRDSENLYVMIQT